MREDQPVSTPSIGDVTSFSDVQAAIAASHPSSSQRCLMPHLAFNRVTRTFYNKLTLVK